MPRAPNSTGVTRQRGGRRVELQQRRQRSPRPRSRLPSPDALRQGQRSSARLLRSVGAVGSVALRQRPGRRTGARRPRRRPHRPCAGSAAPTACGRSRSAPAASGAAPCPPRAPLSMHQDLVAIDQRGQAVRDDHHRPALAEPDQVGVDQRLALRVERAGRLVEDHQLADRRSPPARSPGAAAGRRTGWPSLPRSRCRSRSAAAR